MNIIKLKDIIKPNDDLFNNRLKGRYAYWVQMRYIVPFDTMGHEGYVACEMNIDKLLMKPDGTYPKPFGTPYIDTYTDCDIYMYIDSTETDRINSISEFKIINNFQPDADITIDELKKFRTWLATQLLIFDQNNTGKQLYVLYDKQTTDMLEYYKNGMINETIESLVDMSEYATKPDIIFSPGSCCCSEYTPPTPNFIGIEKCDPVAVYRTYIYNKMVGLFSSAGFWMKYPKQFIMDFKKYIDNIIRLNLPLQTPSYVPDLVDCGMLSRTDAMQSANQSILNNLSQSLNYIINDEVNGHKNYIYDSLNQWSSKLYELMEW